MAKYTGRIKLVILDIGGTVCDGPQDLSNLYPNDDGIAVKGPVVVMDDIFKKYKMDVDWPTIRKPMGLFKKDHLRVILQYDDVTEQFKKAQGHDWTEDDVEEMFTLFRKRIPEVILQVHYFKREAPTPYRTIEAPRASMLASGGHTLPTRLVVENVARGTITEVMYHDLAVDSEIDDRIFSIRTLEQQRPIPSSR